MENFKEEMVEVVIIHDCYGKRLYMAAGDHITASEAIRQAIEKKILLDCAVFNGMDIEGVNFDDYHLCYTCFEGARIRNCSFRSARLIRSSFVGAEITDCDFRGASLKAAGLLFGKIEGNNDFRGANLDNARMNFTPDIPLACPADGSFIGWKKLDEGKIAKLGIPADARRSSATTRKCRCDKAWVIEIKDRSGNECNHGYSIFTDCLYLVGEMVYPDFYDENRWNECSHGIHFFINKQDAINY